MVLSGIEYINMTGERILIRKDGKWFPIESKGIAGIKKFASPFLAKILTKNTVSPDGSVIEGLPKSKSEKLIIVPFEVKSRMVGVRDDLVTIPFDASHRDDGIYCTRLSW